MRSGRHRIGGEKLANRRAHSRELGEIRVDIEIGRFHTKYSIVGGRPATVRTAHPPA
jgi:hypothetical protein